MMKTNNKKKGSTAKKLLPATMMLAVSASMLATSTYAWFTMSREVEVQNIKLTATTPEDIQIAIGKIGSNATTESTAEAYTLAGSTGVLVNSSGEVAAPREEGTENDELDWSNSADISKYYQFGKLIPASSTDGVNVFFTPDADGVGRTVKTGGLYYQAAAGTTEYKYASATNNFTNAGTGDSAKATAYVDNTSGGNDDTWSTAYAKSVSWTETNDDGYYIDIPVWLRTSASDTTNIYVTGYVTKGTNSKTTADSDADDILYQAVRVAVLKADGTADGGVLNLNDGSTYATNKTAYNASTNAAGIKSILDSDNYNTRANVSGINALNATTPGWDAITQNDGATSLGTLNAGDGAGYGTSTKFWVRIWLEGEDGDCWNENAGQDWNISLKFMKTPLANAT
jgi:hypothetical protein